MDKMLTLLLFISFVPLIVCRRHKQDDDDDVCDGHCNDKGEFMHNNIPAAPAKYIAHIRKMCGYGCMVDWRILGGESVKQGHWPWMAAIFVEGNKTDVVKCGGFLISQEYVLSVSTCISAGKNYIVKLGDVKLNKNCEKIPHQTFNVPATNVKIEKGIALIKLDRRVEFNSAVRPICLPFDDHTKGFDSSDKPAYVSGWGDTGMLDSRSMCLQQTKVKVMCADDCRLQYGITIDPAHLCVVPFKGNHRPAIKDEGSPLMILSCTGQWIAYGINAGPNNIEKPAYINTRHFLEWILANSDLHI